jgi:hypothetical protein
VEKLGSSCRCQISFVLLYCESRHSTNIIFKNALTEKARIYWVNYQGEPVRYKTLEPGQVRGASRLGTPLVGGGGNNNLR